MYLRTDCHSQIVLGTVTKSNTNCHNSCSNSLFKANELASAMNEIISLQAKLDVAHVSSASLIQPSNGVVVVVLCVLRVH